MKHELLDRETSPCESSEDYNFAKCIEEKVVDDIGCRPHWMKGLKGKLPLCIGKENYRRFMNEMFNFSIMDKIQMQSKSGCLKPCRYMEYRVSSNIFLQKVSCCVFSRLLEILLHLCLQTTRCWKSSMTAQT